MNSIRNTISNAQLIVVKVGSQLLTQKDGLPDNHMIQRLAEEISCLRSQGRGVILVSSGAIAFGRKALGWDQEIKTIAESQMLASVGQAKLMNAHAAALGAQNLHVGQVLLTHRDVSDRVAYLNVHNTIRALLNQGVVPILNENDTVGYEEIRFGDNDELASLVAALVEADLLILLTEPDGVFTQDPRTNTDAERIKSLDLTDEARTGQIDVSGKSQHGRGGMSSKLRSAAVAVRSGIPVVISSGRREQPLRAVIEGEDVGTYCVAKSIPLEKRRHWLRYGLKSQGSIVLDPGASRAVRTKGASILPVGVVEVRGDFQRGEAIEVLDSNGVVIARGLAAYPANELIKICGVQSSQIEEVLGYRYLNVAVHRDDLILEQDDSEKPAE